MGALCLFLSAIEYMIPKPIPFLRVGIANVPILLCLDLLPVPLLLLVVVLKVLGQGLIGGTLISYVFLFSAAGSFASAFSMLLFRRLFGRRISLVGVGVLGALFSNITQVLLARVLIFGEGAWLIAPPFLALGTVTATLLALFAERFAARSRWLASVRKRLSLPDIARPGGIVMAPKARAGAFLVDNASARMLFIAGALLFPSFLLQQDIAVRAMQIALFLILNMLSGRRIRVAQYLVVSAGIVVFNLVIPTGRVLAAPLGLSITEGALKSGLLKATAMAGLIALSQFSIRSELRLPGRVGGLIGRSLYYFERIMGGRRRIDRKDIIGSVDALLLEVQNAGPAEAAEESARVRSKPPGVAILLLCVAASWGAYVFTLIHPRPIWGG